MKSSFVWVMLAVLVIAGIGWMWYGASKPLTGEVVADLGREHVPPGTKVDYNSNPPTSGNHYADWVKKGVYSAVKEDGYLIHSLEHGYIIISYNCEAHPQSLKLVPQALAHTGNDEATDSASSPQAPSAESTPSATISGGDWELAECKELVAKLAGVYKKKGEDRLIVVPRPSLDTRIALTAWTRIDKLKDFDEERITKFIDAFLNQGPEKTRE